MKKLQKNLAAALAAYDQVKARADAWKAKLPGHFRLGDILIVKPEGIQALPGYLWVLVKQHSDDPQLFFAVIVDDREELVGQSDHVFGGAVHRHVARPTVGTWIHADDMDLDCRVDHAPEGVVEDCRRWVGRPSPEQMLEAQGAEVDGFYLEHLQDLRAWESTFSECLHSEVSSAYLAYVRKVEASYWAWVEARL